MVAKILILVKSEQKSWGDQVRQRDLNLSGRSGKVNPDGGRIHVATEGIFQAYLIRE